MEEWLKILGKLGAAGVAGFLLKWLWDRFWRKKDDGEASAASALKHHYERIITIEKRVEANEVREGERQKALGRMEGEIQRLDGKVGGLQSFWTAKFERMEEKLESFRSELRSELRADQQAFEARLATMLNEHQKRVHDRLNETAAAQAMMINELIDKLVDKVGE